MTDADRIVGRLSSPAAALALAVALRLDADQPVVWAAVVKHRSAGHEANG